VLTPRSVRGVTLDASDHLPALAVFGALTIIGFTASSLPVLIARAPMIFRIPALIYLIVSLVIVADSARINAQAADTRR
jgi:hypothetical protein